MATPSTTQTGITLTGKGLSLVMKKGNEHLSSPSQASEIGSWARVERLDLVLSALAGKRLKMYLKREVSKHQETFSLLNLCRALEAQRAT